MTAIRLNGATSGTGVLATFAYDDLGRRTALNRGNGTSTTYAYDPVSRLTSLTQDLAGTVRDLTVTLGSYNPAGQIGSRSRSNDAYAWTQAYNVNRNYTANGLNQLTLSGAATLGYDTRGNLTSDGTATFAYDTENRMTGIVAGGYGNFAYDPLGRLVGTCCGLTGDTTWGYDGDHLAIKTATSSGGPLERYVFGPGGDEPLVLFYGGDTSTPRWLHADERGSIVATSDASGTVLATNAYDDYGIPQNPMGGGNAIGPFGYTGQMWVPEAGVYNYKARFYSPTLGRFMQTDPIGYEGGNNLYQYVSADPVNYSDPSGLAACSLIFSFDTILTGFFTGHVHSVGTENYQASTQGNCAGQNTSGSPTSGSSSRDLSKYDFTKGAKVSEKKPIVVNKPAGSKVIRNPCGGSVRAEGVNLTAILGLGVTLSVGKVTSNDTGKSSIFVSVGLGAGLDAGISGFLTGYKDISSFKGYGESANLSGRLGTRTVGGSVSYNAQHNIVGGSVSGSGVPVGFGLRAGASGTVTDTSLIGGDCR